MASELLLADQELDRSFAALDSFELVPWSVKASGIGLCEDMAKPLIWPDDQEEGVWRLHYSTGVRCVVRLRACRVPIRGDQIWSVPK